MAPPAPRGYICHLILWSTARVSLDTLFQPFRHKGLSLKNRIVMAPMTRSFSPEGVPGADVAEYYRRRATGEVGLILSEGTAIARPSAKNDPRVPDFHGGAALAGWKTVIDTVHAAGGKMGPQLWHVGAARKPHERVARTAAGGQPLRPLLPRQALRRAHDR